MGGGVSGRVHFSCFFFTFNVKIMSKNWKKNDKTMVRKKKRSPHLWWSGGVSKKTTKIALCMQIQALDWQKNKKSKYISGNI